MAYVREFRLNPFHLISLFNIEWKQIILQFHYVQILFLAIVYANTSADEKVKIKTCMKRNIEMKKNGSNFGLFRSVNVYDHSSYAVGSLGAETISTGSFREV